MKLRGTFIKWVNVKIIHILNQISYSLSILLHSCCCIPHTFDDDDSNSSCFYKAHGVKCVKIRSFFWSVFSHIWAEYRKIQYLLVFRPNVWKYGPEKILYLDTSHAVVAFILAIFFTLGVVEKSSVLFCNSRSYFCFSFESKFILTSIYKSISWLEYGKPVIDWATLTLTPKMELLMKKCSFSLFSKLGGSSSKKCLKMTKNSVYRAYISQELYIIWSSCMIHMCKRIISSGFRFLNFYFQGQKWGKRAKNGLITAKSYVCCTPYLRKHRSYDHDFWYTFV